MRILDYDFALKIVISYLRDQGLFIAANRRIWHEWVVQFWDAASLPCSEEQCDYLINDLGLDHIPEPYGCYHWLRTDNVDLYFKYSSCPWACFFDYNGPSDRYPRIIARLFDKVDPKKDSSKVTYDVIATLSIDLFCAYIHGKYTFDQGRSRHLSMAAMIKRENIPLYMWYIKTYEVNALEQADVLTEFGINLKPHLFTPAYFLELIAGLVKVRSEDGEMSAESKKKIICLAALSNYIDVFDYAVRCTRFTPNLVDASERMKRYLCSDKFNIAAYYVERGWANPRGLALLDTQLHSTSVEALLWWWKNGGQLCTRAYILLRHYLPPDDFGAAALEIFKRDGTQPDAGYLPKWISIIPKPLLDLWMPLYLDLPRSCKESLTWSRALAEWSRENQHALEYTSYPDYDSIASLEAWVAEPSKWVYSSLMQTAANRGDVAAMDLIYSTYKIKFKSDNRYYIDGWEPLKRNRALCIKWLARNPDYSSLRAKAISPIK